MKSIIFNKHQINYALKNKEVVFRVVIKNPNNCHISYRNGERGIGAYFTIGGFRAKNGFKKSCFKVGETIFVKEVWGIGSRPDEHGGYDGFEYRADQLVTNDIENLPCYPIDYDELPEDVVVDNWIGNWQQARLMPQWASRLTLRIKDIRVERLADISEEDAVKEGISGGLVHLGYLSGIDAFSAVWNSTHKKPEEKWEANPWVFVYEYEVI